MLERGQQEGEVRSDIPADLLMLLFLGGVQMVIQTQVLGAFEAPEHFEERGAELVTDAFLKGARPR
jgi:hypothetical protein